MNETSNGKPAVEFYCDRRVDWLSVVEGGGAEEKLGLVEQGGDGENGRILEY